MSEERSLAVQPEHSGAISVQRVIDRLDGIQELMKRAMHAGTDYGVIPGTNSKPTLLKAGAEKLCVMFQFAPKYSTVKTWHNDSHLTVESTCQILSLDGSFLGEASAMCSTREVKYAYRKAERTCPECGKPAIIKGKAEYGGGWLCWAKKGGCNHKFADNDTRITGQTGDRIPNPDIADSYNTVARIAEKRAFVAAVRLVTGSSGFFDEEGPGHGEQESEAVKDLKKNEGEPKSNGKTDGGPPDSVDTGTVQAWLNWLGNVGADVERMNKDVRDINAITHQETQAYVWKLVYHHGRKQGWTWNAKQCQWAIPEPAESGAA